MERPAFITPAMSILLDAVRGIAALLVLGGHMVQVGLYTGPYPFGPTMQHNAVVVFFVLSGLVIAHSVQARRYSLPEYAIARAARILPVSLFAIALGVALFLLAGDLVEVPAGREWYTSLTPGSVILPALFLSESAHGAGPVWNPPYWSLAYEVWFYALFAAAVFLNGKRRVMWLALLVYIAGWRILLMLPVWLIGAWLSRYGGAFRIGPARGVQLCLLGVVAMLLSNGFGNDAADLAAGWHRSFGYELKFSGYFLTDYVFGTGVALCFVGMRGFADTVEPAVRRASASIEQVAGFSFTLYLIHWPILLVLSGLGVKAGADPLGFLALATGIVLVAAGVARLTEHRNHDIRAWLRRRTPWRTSEPVAV